MASGPHKRAALLVQNLKRVQEGDVKHVTESPLPAPFRTRLDAAVAGLEAAIARCQAAKAGSHEATQSQNEVLTEAQATMAAVRRSVYAMYTDKDRVVEDYGLSVKSARRKPKDDAKETSTGTPSTGSKA